MTRLLWLVRSVLALLLVAGGGYKLFAAGELAALFPALPVAAWQLLGVVEAVGGVLLLIPERGRWGARHTGLTAVVLCIEALGISAIYARESTVMDAENPLVWSVVMALLLALVAYGALARVAPWMVAR